MATWDELTAVRPGAALRLRGDEFVVERCGRFEDPDGGWLEHRLSSNASGQGVSTDIIEAAALAYIRALSNVEAKVVLAAETAETEEPVLTQTP